MTLRRWPKHNNIGISIRSFLIQKHIKNIFHVGMYFILFECLHFKAMSRTQNDAWDKVKKIAYDVVVEQKERGAAYEGTVARTLGVNALYMVSIDHGSLNYFRTIELFANIFGKMNVFSF